MIIVHEPSPACAYRHTSTTSTAHTAATTHYIYNKHKPVVIRLARQ